LKGLYLTIAVVALFVAAGAPLALGLLAGFFGDPRALLKMCALSAAALAATAAGVRLLAHGDSPALDWFGKALGFDAAVLAVWVAGLLFALGD
jgi:hypothetical protein